MCWYLAWKLSFHQVPIFQEIFGMKDNNTTGSTSSSTSSQYNSTYKKSSHQNRVSYNIIAGSSNASANAATSVNKNLPMNGNIQRQRMSFGGSKHLT
jgi:hypothetical protein